MIGGIRRAAWLAGGVLSLALGAIGAVLPLLPTVPFVILAAFCFARSSPRLEARLTNHPRFGPHILAWREKGAISRKGKRAALAAFAVSTVIAFIFAPMPAPLITLTAAAILGTWIWTRPEG